jgi:superfamily II DNA helicase RecQ
MAGEFFTPELITETKWQRVLSGDVYRARIKAFVIDEARCIKKWYVINLMS